MCFNLMALALLMVPFEVVWCDSWQILNFGGLWFQGDEIIRKRMEEII